MQFPPPPTLTHTHAHTHTHTNTHTHTRTHALHHFILPHKLLTAHVHLRGVLISRGALITTAVVEML